jgi:hypothetical protein
MKALPKILLWCFSALVLYVTVTVVWLFVGIPLAIEAKTVSANRANDLIWESGWAHKLTFETEIRIDGQVLSQMDDVVCVPKTETGGDFKSGPKQWDMLIPFDDLETTFDLGKSHVLTFELGPSCNSIVKHRINGALPVRIERTAAVIRRKDQPLVRCTAFGLGKSWTKIDRLELIGARLTGVSEVAVRDVVPRARLGAADEREYALPIGQNTFERRSERHRRVDYVWTERSCWGGARGCLEEAAEACTIDW